VSVTANGFGLLGLPNLLNSTGQDVRSNDDPAFSETLVIFITQTNVPALGVVSFNSLFTNNLLPNSWTVDLQTWWDPANQTFGLVNRVGEEVFHTSGGSPSTVFPGVDTGNFGLITGFSSTGGPGLRDRLTENLCWADEKILADLRLSHFPLGVNRTDLKQAPLLAGIRGARRGPRCPDAPGGRDCAKR
jgi:hypothetical protein